MPSNPLIGPDELGTFAELGASEPPVLLDVRWQLGGPPGRGAYLAGHLPGAVYVDLDADLAAPPGKGGRHPLPDPADFERAMRRAGVRQDRPVVVYDQRDTVSAGRAWWLLGYHGHPRVRVLDGGYDGWVARGLPVVTEVPVPEPGDFEARPGGRPLLDADGAAEVARRGVLLDVRAAARYRGEEEPVDPVAGHIPGAVSVPSGQGLPPAVLEADEIVAYCGSGVVACVALLELARAGRPDAKLYAGSWSEWSRRGLPVERG